MRTFALATGSSGNCFYVESKSNIKVLIDLGLSFSKIKEVLDEKGIDVLSIDAVCLTHEHSDHIVGLESFMKKVKCPIYMSRGTFTELNIQKSNKINFVKHHDKFSISDLNVFVLNKPHDAKEAISFVVECDDMKMGVFTDIGHITDEVKHVLKTLDIVYFEANYCERIIKEKGKNLSFHYLNRLMSDIGHLSISQSCEALVDFALDKQKIILSHISENTNSYENTYTIVKSYLSKFDKFPELIVGFQGEPTEWIE